MPEHPTRYVAERVCEVGLVDAPPEAVRIAKDTFLDTVGCMLAGSAEPGGRKIADFARRMGSGPASIVGRPERVSSYMAALANGTSAALLDFDDTNWRLIGHPSGSLVPAVVAIGEERRVSGRAALEAYMVGFEAVTKIARGLMPGMHTHGRHSTGALGVFGATAACAKLLQLDATQTATAFGIAASCSGALQGNWGSMTKGLHSGEAAANGLMSARLAADGFTARPDIFECKYGFAQTGVLDGSARLDEIGRDFANPWDCVDPGVGIKLFPSGTVSFCAGECALELVTRHAFEPSAIESVEWRMTGPGYGLSRFPVPNDPEEAYYSTPWAIAAGLVDRKIGLAQFSAERIGDPAVRALCAKVKLSVHPDFVTVDDPKDNVAGELVVRLKDGRELRHFRRRPRAYPGGEPWTRDQLLGKYREAAGRALDPECVERSIELLSEIETLPNLTELTEMLRPVAAP
ncbi:MAG: MmgE/PrpD family protein [Chloroflexi bacterium]|nr:MmgE/PrpD family protein [Chloroflexota bacterium]